VNQRERTTLIVVIGFVQVAIFYIDQEGDKINDTVSSIGSNIVEAGFWLILFFGIVAALLEIGPFAAAAIAA
jgi:hypothetical protein